MLQLYDPDRSQSLTLQRRDPRRGAISSAALRETLGATAGQGRRGHPHPHRDRDLADDGGAVRAPSRSSIRRRSGISGSRPGAHSARAAARAGIRRSPSTPTTISRNANVVVSLDSDFLASGPASLRYARQFAARRRVRGNQTEMNRLYVVEPMPTPTGTKADHRLPLRAGDIEEFAWALATGLGAANGPKTGREPRYLQVDRRRSRAICRTTRARAW